MAVRLDKYLAHAGFGTRSEVKKLIRSGRVLLGNAVVKRPEEKVSLESRIFVDGKAVFWSEYEYLMLNKPKGVVSAVQDDVEKTVVDLVLAQEAVWQKECLPSEDAHKLQLSYKKLFPVGRLDKDTEGLLLLTNDGALAHELLSPGKHVEKTYQVWVEGMVTGADKELFARGLDIGDEKMTKPAKLGQICYYDHSGKLIGKLQEQGEDALETDFREIDICQTRLLITITEGRYHQVKRMFAKVGKPVQYLKRISMGNLILDEKLAPGEYRRLTEGEIASLK